VISGQCSVFSDQWSVISDQWLVHSAGGHWAAEELVVPSLATSQ